jgi:ADYC domain
MAPNLLTFDESALAATSGAPFRRRVGFWLRWSATMVLAAMVLCGCTVSIGFDHGPAPGEIAGNPDLRIVDGHFASAGNFGFGGGGAVGEIVVADGARLRIDAAKPDPADPSGEIVLYRFSQIGAGGAVTPYCRGDSGGFGFPIAGSWIDGDHMHAPGQVSVVCLGTAAARCVDLGYRPWRKGPNGADLWDYHQACVRALRADYCGTGQSHVDGNGAVALYDRLGIQPLQASAGMSFEAAWGASGASCVNHTRSPGRMTLKDLRVECANFPKARLGSSCDERDPALIFTKSPASPAS